MGRAGRKRKQGKRTKSGRDRLITPFDHGTMRAQAMQALYGTDGCDAIGRAFRSGLLGEGSEAKCLLDTARRLSNIYWRAYETGAIKCPIADQSTGSIISLDDEKIRRREEWLRDCLKFVAKMGVRKTFDELVIDVNPDSGPNWLDALCYEARQNNGEVDRHSSAYAKLRAALDGLEAIAA